MAISWGTVKSLAIFFGPILLPKAITWYRAQKANASQPGVTVRPVPRPVSRALFVLFVVACVFLIRTIPTFSPENVFNLTSSRLQIPTDVLFTRLSALRTAGLTPNDSLLRTKLASLESRLLYFQFGPDVLTNCQFCNAEDPKSYLYYFFPALLAPHILNLIVIAGVTSGLAIGKEGAAWRTTGVIASGVLMGLDLWITATYNYQENSRATRLEEIDTFFWKMRVYRFLGLAALDGVLGYLIYLSSTNRAFVTPMSSAERIEKSTRILDTARSKIAAMAILRNTISRDEVLRERSKQYWVQEGQVMGQLMEERDTIESVNNALENRIDMQTIIRDADSYAESVIGPLNVVPD